MAENNPTELLFRILDKAGKIAGRLKLAAIPILILDTIVAIVGYYYFWDKTNLGAWSWGIPTLIMGLPLLSVVAVIYILYCVAEVPQTMRNASANLGSIVSHHKDNLRAIEKRKFGKFKYLKTVGKILWDSVDVVDGVSMAAFVSTPIFWFLYVCTFLGSFLLSGIMILTIVIYHIVT